MSVINKIRMTAANISSGSVSASFNGRTYSCAAGSTIDVIESDAITLESRGFLRLGVVGATANRPTYPPNANSDSRIVANPLGYEFIDSTIGKVVRYNGATWVDVVTGASE
jgi:hypothetical protein